MADFRGYVTAAGQTFEALAKQMGYPVTIGFIEVGDGKLPDSESPIDRTQLVHKLKQFPAIVEQDVKNPGQWVATCYIPADDAINGAGYFIREIGCKLINQGNGVLYAYRRVSDDWKPVITSGEAKSFIYKLRFIPSNGELLTPTIDPSVVLVDKEELSRAMSEHVQSSDHPYADEERKGMVRLASLLQLISNDESSKDAVVSVDKVWKLVSSIFSGEKKLSSGNAWDEIPSLSIPDSDVDFDYQAKAFLSRFNYLQSELGVTKVGGAVISVASLKSAIDVDLKPGMTVLTRGYYSEGDGGHAKYFVCDSQLNPDGFGDHRLKNGKCLMLTSSPTDINHGVLVGEETDIEKANNNRLAIQSMLRNSRFSSFELCIKGKYFVLGSIHPLRSNIKIKHRKGCHISGIYNHPDYPSSLVSQGGHMFGFSHFKNPDDGDFTVVETVKGVSYELDGDVSTIYSVNHHRRHNNNCIGFFDSEDCIVAGNGGVSGSDHRGICFDGLSRNCHIDINYSRGTMDEPAVMKGTTETTQCSVKIKNVSETSFGGPNDPIVVRTQDAANVLVDIGSFTWDGLTKPQLVGAFNCGTIIVVAGIVNGVSQILRQYDTLDSDVRAENILNTQFGIVRAGTASSRMRSARLRNIKFVDAVFSGAFKAESNVDRFGTLSIRDNDFTAASPLFAYYVNKLTVGLPRRFDLAENTSPPSFSPVGGELNEFCSGVSANLAVLGSTSASFSYKQPDWVFGVVSIVVSSGGLSYQGEIMLRVRDMTSLDITHNIGPVTVTSKKSGSQLTLEAAGGTFQMVFMHN